MIFMRRKKVHNMMHDQFYGILFVCIGGLLVTIALGTFILRLALALFGLWVMQLGLRILGGPHWLYIISHYQRRWW